MDGMDHNYPPILILIISLANMKYCWNAQFAHKVGEFYFISNNIDPSHHFPKLSNVFCTRHITVNNNYPQLLF